VNRLDYLVENGARLETVVVKTGVPRDVALKLEANKLALPGIEVDGDILVRRYLGGEAMSHVLGYVGQVGPEDVGQETGELTEAERRRLRDERNIALLLRRQHEGPGRARVPDGRGAAGQERAAEAGDDAGRGSSARSRRSRWRRYPARTCN
jgi:cell division protein FtsI/penicillin-binding protein 2